MIGGKDVVIYLDNSATSYPKPMAVREATFQTFQRYGANPGRSGHTMSRESGMEIEKCRRVAAKMFGAFEPKDVAFTLNCTQAINLVMKGLLKPGDHVVTSSVEHNAVMRPLRKMEKKGIITFSVAQVYPKDPEKTVDSFRKAINSKTALIVCSHASNVWGIRMPVERIAALARVYEIPILVDAAQSAGILPINILETGIDYLCVAGHKGLYGPMGTGMLITHYADNLETIIEGGTGTDSMTFCQPQEMPQKFESGTPNFHGICGLRAGMEFVNQKGISNIFKHEMSLIIYLYDKLKGIKGVKLYMPRPDFENFVPVLSFNVSGYVSDEIGKILDHYGIEVRTGLHCAPAAHDFGGTIDIGTVRVSPSIFTTKTEINKLVEVVKNIKPKF